MSNERRYQQILKAINISFYSYVIKLLLLAKQNVWSVTINWHTLNESVKIREKSLKAKCNNNYQTFYNRMSKTIFTISWVSQLSQFVFSIRKLAYSLNNELGLRIVTLRLCYLCLDINYRNLYWNIAFAISHRELSNL